MERFLDTYTPSDWSRYDIGRTLVPVPKDTINYEVLESKIRGRYNLGVTSIVKIENPYLYMQFELKKQEYETGGPVKILELFHDTAQDKVNSIAETNLDYRLAKRVKYGKGVSFSPFPDYANQESSRYNGTHRAMIVADVLIQKEERVCDSKQLPRKGYDTTVGNCGNVYVKYYDDEFYPKYAIYYTSKPHTYPCRW